MWKKLTAEDLSSKLAQREIDSYSRSSFAQTEPVDALLQKTVDEVRGFIASGRKCSLDPDESTIPPMLVSAVLDYTVFNLLKRIDSPVSDPRIKAYDRAVALFDKLATGAIVPPDVDELRRAVDDEEAWAQEFLCQFIDGSSVLLPYDLLAKCESFEASTDMSLDELVAKKRAGARFFGGLDFGRTSDPSVLWLDEQVGDVYWTRLVKVMKNANTVDQFAAYRPYLELCDKVCVDYTGPGVGFGDICEKELGASRNPDDPKKVELCVFTPAFKREIFPKFRARLDGLKKRLPVDVEVREDLHEMQDVVKDGVHNYFARRTAEGHSDRCTAAALCTRAESFASVPAMAATAQLDDRFDITSSRKRSRRSFL